MPEYIPKGGLCMNCANFRRDCSQLDFARMHVIKIYPDGVKAVKCTEYHKGKHERLPESDIAKRAEWLERNGK